MPTLIASAPASISERISASLTRTRFMMRDLSWVSSLLKPLPRAAFLSWLISSTQAPSSLTTSSQLPARAALATGRVRTLPTVFELLRGGVQLNKQLREVRVEDVLGRDPVVRELDAVFVTDWYSE